MKRTSRFGIREKLIGVLVGTAFLALLLACGSFVYYDRVTYSEAKQRSLEVLARSVSQSASGPTAFQDPESAATMLHVLEHERSALAAAVYTSEGSLLTEWHEKSDKTAFPKQAKSLSMLAQQEDVLRLTTPIRSAEQEVGKLVVAFSTSDVRARTHRFLQIAAGVLGISALLALVLATIAQRLLTAPVDILVAAAHRVQTERDFDVRARRISNDELGQLTDAFNDMLSMIQARDQELAEHRAGLEDLVAKRTRDLDQRNQEMRLVLDNVDQGLLMLDRDGVPRGERSAAAERWFSPESGETFGHMAGRAVPGFEVRFGMHWEQLVDGFLPLEVNLAQLPHACETADGRHFELAYRPVGGSDPEQFDRLLVIVSDVTEQVKKARAESLQAQVIAVMEQAAADRAATLAFRRDTERALAFIDSDAPRDHAVIMRELHTLKGNFGLFGLKALARLVHEIEDGCLESGEPPQPDERARLLGDWNALWQRAGTFLGDGTRTLSVDPASIEALLQAVKSQRPHAEIAMLAARLTREPVEPKLARLASHAKTLAEKLGKGAIDVHVQAEGVLVSPELHWLWQVLPHVVANSVDHGLDDPTERSARGKLTKASLRLAALEQPSEIVVEVQDDGRGIDWERVRSRAERLGMPAATRDQLVNALFSDGVSTRDQATEVSGRGVGLAAVRAACAENGASIGVVSEPGKGTLFRFTVANDVDRSAVKGVA